MSLSSPPPLPRTRGRRALVVGGTSGIGRGIASALARRGYEVIVAGRSAERGAEVVEELSALAPSAPDGGRSPGKQQHSFHRVDAFDLKSVRDIADRFRSSGGSGSKDEDPKKQVDFLVMTQGMATIQGYTPTAADGIDEKLQLHYFSRLYLAALMAPHMEEEEEEDPGSSSPPRVILTVLSAGVHGRYGHYDDDFELKNGNYSIRNAADAAGFYTDAGFERLSREHPNNLVVAHAAPGFVDTNWGAEFPWLLRMAIVRPLQALFGRSRDECGELLTRGCLDVATATGSGYHLLDRYGKPIENGVRHTPEERDVIWEKTLKVLPDLGQ